MTAATQHVICLSITVLMLCYVSRDREVELMTSVFRSCCCHDYEDHDAVNNSKIRP